MKDQVTSIEQSLRLLELGVPAKKASMVYVNNSDIPSFKAELVSSGIDLEELVSDGHEYTPAFTVADLLGMMPRCINGYYSFTLYVQGRGWGIEWVDGDLCVGQMYHEHLLILICDRIEWLLSNGYNEA